MVKNLAVFVSGRGSNLLSILKKIESGYINCSVKAIVSDKLDCGAFQLRETEGIKKISVSSKIANGFITWNELSDQFDFLRIDLIVLAGFLKKVPDDLINRFPNKIINIHPALLPSFGGKGMYGHFVHENVFNRSCQVSGATVHFVDSVYDNGKIILQECVDINGVKSPYEIAERVLKIEHNLLPLAIKKIIEGKVLIEDKRIHVLD